MIALGIILQQFVATLCACVLLCLTIWTYKIGIGPGPKPGAKDRRNGIEAAAGAKDIVRLRNGNTIRGIITQARGKTVVLTWEGGTVTLGKEEIRTIEWSKTGVADRDAEIVFWPYRHNPIIRLTNQHILDGQIMEVRSEYIVLREELKTDSYIDYQIQKERIESIEFSSFPGARSNNVQRILSQCYPKLGEYEGLMRYAKTVFTGREGSIIPGEAGAAAHGILSRIWGAVTGR